MTAPLKVAHIIASTGLYGAERWILALVRSLDPRQVDSTLVNLVDAPGKTSAVVHAARARDIKAIDLHTGGRFNPSGLLLFSGWIRRSGIDILHSHGYKSDMYSIFASRFLGRKVISTPHGWSMEAKDWKLKLYESLDRWCMRFIDRVCPLSPELWKDIEQSGVSENRNIYIPNGVDLEEIDLVTARNEKPTGSVVIGYVGQLIERKNIPVLFKAFKTVSEKRENLRLCLVGDGPLRQSLSDSAKEMEISSRVEFTGYCEDALAWMKTFDMFVLPSQLEGIPRCVMEAVALGIPVIASDIPGNREIVEHMRTGLLFPLDEPGSLAESTLFILDHPAETREMCRRAREKVERQFSAKRMAEDYLSLYQDVLARRNQGCA